MKVVDRVKIDCYGNGDGADVAKTVVVRVSVRAVEWGGGIFGRGCDVWKCLGAPEREEQDKRRKYGKKTFFQR